MKYILKLAARTTLDESVEIKHNALINGLKKIDKPWGIIEGEYPAPNFGEQIIANFSLKHILNKNIKGDVMYRYRRLLDDISSNDDVFYIEFNPKKIDYKALVDQAFKQYIGSFNPYFAAIYDEQLIFLDFEKSRNKNLREAIVRFYPVCFLDNKLCERALGLSAKEVSKKLISNVEKIELFNNGVLIIASSKLLTIEESNAVDTKITSLLRN